MFKYALIGLAAAAAYAIGKRKGADEELKRATAAWIDSKPTDEPAAAPVHDDAAATAGAEAAIDENSMRTAATSTSWGEEQV